MCSNFSTITCKTTKCQCTIQWIWCSSIKVRMWTVLHRSKHLEPQCRDNRLIKITRTVWLKFILTASRHLFSLQEAIKFHHNTSSLIREVQSHHQDSPVPSSQGNNWTTCHNRMAKTVNHRLRLNSNNSWHHITHLLMVLAIRIKWVAISPFFHSSPIKCHLSNSRLAKINTRDKQALAWVVAKMLSSSNSTI